MPAAISTATVRGRALTLTGMPLANFGDTAALNTEIVADAKALHDDMILSNGHYQRDVLAVPVSVGVQLEALPNEVYLVETGHFVEGGAQPSPIELEQWSPAYLGEVLALPQGRGRPRWFDITAGLAGLQPVDQWRLWPTPDRAGVLHLTYIRAVAFPVSGGESLIYAGSGWEDYLVYALAAKLLGAEETYDHPHYTEREKCRARVMALAGRRHAGPPARTPIRPPVAGSRARDRFNVPTMRT